MIFTGMSEVRIVVWSPAWQSVSPNTLTWHSGHSKQTTALNSQLGHLIFVLLFNISSLANNSKPLNVNCYHIQRDQHNGNSAKYS